MDRLKQFVGYLLLGIGLASAQAHASIIQSMTIEEIGIASNGLGTSGISNVGGQFTAAGLASDGFVSADSIDGAILMGHMQGVHAFTHGFAFFETPALPHTLNGAPTGYITGGSMVLDLSGWGTLWSGIEFALFPDAGTLLTSISQLDNDRFYYTADWSHVITSAENNVFAGIPVTWHLEGIATVPEPNTLWLAGIALSGLIWARRAKRH
jgi:hypothetical protein